MEFTGVHAGELDKAWPMVEGYIENALDYADGKYTTEDVKQDIIDEKKQLWVAYNGREIFGVIVTEILIYPQDSRLRFFVIAGKEFDEWVKFEEIVFNWAKSLGCTKVETCGRPGWTRKLKDRGYELIHTILRREL